MPGMIEVKVAHQFSASAEQVFDAWLQPDSARQWMIASLKSMGLEGDVRRVEIDARVQGKFTFSDMRDGNEAVHWGYYHEISRPHRLVFTWFTSEEEEQENASLVTLVITPLEQGCRATITHSMDARYEEYIPQTENGWGTLLKYAGSLARQ